MPPKFDDSFLPVAAPKATPALWAWLTQPDKRGHQATPPQLLRGRRCAPRGNGRVGVAQTGCAAWTRPRKSPEEATPPQPLRGRRCAQRGNGRVGVAQTGCAAWTRPRKSPEEATPPQVSRGRRYEQTLGSAPGVAHTDCRALPRRRPVGCSSRATFALPFRAGPHQLRASAGDSPSLPQGHLVLSCHGVGTSSTCRGIHSIQTLARTTFQCSEMSQNCWEFRPIFPCKNSTASRWAPRAARARKRSRWIRLV